MLRPTTLQISERPFTPNNPVMYSIMLEDCTLATTQQNRIKNVQAWLGKQGYSNYKEMLFTDKVRLISSGLI